jgi:hypothetical protein
MGVGGSNSDDWRKNLAICLLCGVGSLAVNSCAHVHGAKFNFDDLTPFNVVYSIILFRWKGGDKCGFKIVIERFQGELKKRK